MERTSADIKVCIQKLSSCKDLPLPAYMTNSSSGVDLYAAVNDEVKILPGDIELIPTGIKISIPDGYEAQIRPRSGLAAKYGIAVLNSPGTIDADYRGEIKVILINLGRNEVTIKRGNRIAQMVFQKIIRACFTNVEKLEGSDRGTGGFGHTGV